MINILLYGLAILGLLAIVVGLLLIGLLAIRGEAGPTGEVEINLFEGTFEVTGGEPLLLMALGIGMVLFPAVVIARYRGVLGSGGLPAELKRKNDQLSRTPKLQNGQFTLSKLEDVIDLRNRKEMSLAEIFGPGLSTTSRRVKTVIKDIDPDVQEIHFFHATTGYMVEPSAKPEGANWRVVVDEKSALYTPGLDLLTGRKTFDDLLARGGRLDSNYSLSVPVVAGPGQEIWYELTYHNGFQGRKGDWAGNVFIADTDLFKLTVVFPEDRPFKTFKAQKGNPKDPFPYAEIGNPEVETDPDHHRIEWTVRNAKEGEAYVLRWDW